MRVIFLLILYLLLSVASIGAIDLDSLLRATVGGERSYARLAEANSYLMSGSMQVNGQSGRFTFLFAQPNRHHFQVDLVALTFIQAYDGKTYWQQDQNGIVTEPSGFELRDHVRLAYLQSYAYLFPNRIPGSAEYIGKDDIEGILSHHVALYPLNADTISLYIDITTGLVHRYVSRLDNLELTTLLENYKSFDGVLSAVSNITFADSAPIRSEIVIENIRYDTPFDSAIFSPPTANVKDYHFPDDRKSVAVPFIMSNDHIYVAVRVNGKAKRMFILDSGAAANILQPDLVDLLQMKKVGSLPAGGVAGYDTVDLVQTDSLIIGDLILYRQVCGTIELGQFAGEVNGIPFGGLLGYDFLSRFPILIDFDRSMLIVYDTESFEPPKNGEEVQFQLLMRAPVVSARLDSLAGKFILDTGNRRGIIIHSSFVRKHNLRKRLRAFTGQTQSLLGVGGAVAARSAVVETFAIGNLVLDDVSVLLVDDGAGITASKELAGNIGMPLLMQFNILFDYDRNRIIFYQRE